jgi:hypothetical protein
MSHPFSPSSQSSSSFLFPATLRHWLQSLGLPSQPKNLREFTRTPVLATATLLPQYEPDESTSYSPTRPPQGSISKRSTLDGPVICGYTTDLGIQGFHLVCAQRLAVGTACQIMLLEGEQTPETLIESPQLSIEASGKVVRITDAGLALEFTTIVGKYSFERLRTLLLAHSPEADRIEGELQTTSWSYETQTLVPTAQRKLPPPRKTLITRLSPTARLPDSK